VTRALLITNRFSESDTNIRFYGKTAVLTGFVDMKTRKANLIAFALWKCTWRRRAAGNWLKRNPFGLVVDDWPFGSKTRYPTADLPRKPAARMTYLGSTAITP